MLEGGKDAFRQREHRYGQVLDAQMVGEGPGPKRHATLPQFWIQRENWEFETHRLAAARSWGFESPLPHHL